MDVINVLVIKTPLLERANSVQTINGADVSLDSLLVLH